MAQPIANHPDEPRGRRPGPRPLTVRRGTPRLLARFDDRTQAREAMLALESAGIDGNDLGLMGPNATRASRRARRRQPDQVDGQIARWVALHSLTASARFAVVGGAVGLVVGLVAAIATGSWILVPAAAVTVAAIGSIVGAMIGVERSTSTSDSWELTFHEGPRDSVWVAVYAGNVGHAHDVLRDQGASDVRRPADLDALGKLFGGVDTGRRTL